MKNLTDFTGLYPLSKTLRFELIPQGKTLEHIEKNGLLETDAHRAENYILVKKIIDEYHKSFISNALSGFRLFGLEDYYMYYHIQKRDDEQKKKFDEIQLKLRKQIAERFTKHESYKNLFAKELIKDELKTFVQTIEEKELVKEFESFTTYFTGFHENRKNMYSADDKSTAIAYRLIHQNLPKFIDNMQVFDKIMNSPVKNHFETILLDTQLGPVVQVLAVEDIFRLDYFNETLTQTGIDKYNALIGGYTPQEGKEKIKGLNEYINLYNQSAKKEERIPKLKPLFKQILSDRSSTSFIPDEFKNDSEVLESIELFYQEVNEHVVNKNVDGEHSLKGLLNNLAEYDLSKIYLRNDLTLTDISQKMFGEWGIFQKAMNVWYEANYKGKHKPGTEKYEEEQKKYFSNQDSFSVGFLNECLQLLDTQYHRNVAAYFGLKGKTEQAEDLFELLEQKYKLVVELLNNPYPAELNLAQEQNNVDKIKDLLDAVKAIQWFMKPLLGVGNEADKDERFYGEFTALWITLDQITPLYNKVRNYMTRKPYSTEKIKLNFENSTLLDGWDVNKEEANASILFEKNGNYYLGIMDKNHNKVFRKIPKSKTSDTYRKVNYKLLPGASKMLPKVFFGNSNIGYYNPSDEILRIRNHGSHTKNGKPQEGFEKTDFSLIDCRIMIDYFKQSIEKHEDWKKFGFAFSETNSYQSIDEFYREVEGQGYSITYTSIDNDYISQLVDEGKLYLFQIYNKDFSPSSKGTPNLHTIYWKMLFDAGNLKDVVYKLNGQAEVFYRKASIKKDNIILHKAHQPVNNKNEETIKTKHQSLFEYDIIKDKRFTVDKFQFHVPITMNFKARGLNNINTEVNQWIQQTTDIHIIGLDRGERHLLYLTLIDSNGNIKKQFTLNEIVNEYEGKTYKTDYHKLLDKREGGRDEARKNWKTIETIKELKEGYLSQVIHKISELMVEYNAIVVLEDLNMGFMRGRQKVEKQVYQKFEKMLIDKLNYLVDKKKSATEQGGTLQALQLTNKFESFQKMGKQSGFLYYVPAWNTSKMDPVTGFVNLFDTRYENIENARKFFAKFESISYNANKNYFEFSFDYNKFTAKAEGTKTNWTVCTHGTRIETFRNAVKNSQWDNREVVLTEQFKMFFEKYGIDYTSVNLMALILLQTEKSFFEGLLFLFKLTLQMRNSITGSDIDFLISPVANTNGDFYDSRTAGATLPQNADANGAYNIARKGMWVIEQIRETSDFKKLKLAISNKEWLAFVQR
jgi:CRISPR-associated protein Cpf1